MTDVEYSITEYLLYHREGILADFAFKLNEPLFIDAYNEALTQEVRDIVSKALNLDAESVATYVDVHYVKYIFSL